MPECWPHTAFMRLLVPGLIVLAVLGGVGWALMAPSTDDELCRPGAHVAGGSPGAPR